MLNKKTVAYTEALLPASHRRALAVLKDRLLPIPAEELFNLCLTWEKENKFLMFTLWPYETRVGKKIWRWDAFLGLIRDMLSWELKNAHHERAVLASGLFYKKAMRSALRDELEARYDSLREKYAIVYSFIRKTRGAPGL